MQSLVILFAVVVVAAGALTAQEPMRAETLVVSAAGLIAIGVAIGRRGRR